MKIHAFVVALSLSVLPFLSHAEGISEGVVVEGESLPIGIALGDTFGTVDAAIGAIEEFDLFDPNDSFCKRTTCTYIARNSLDEELGSVSIYFRYDSNLRSYIARTMRWTFEDWVTTAGLSLKALKDEIRSEEELLAFYPDGNAFVVDGARSLAAQIRSSADGIWMVSSQTTVPGRGNTLFGRISQSRR